MNNFFAYKLLEINKFYISVFHISLILGAALFSVIFLALIRASINRSTRLDKGRKYALYQLIKYFFLVIVISIALDQLGLNITMLIAGSAALLVGVGLGLQNLFNDFVSGIIILIDASIKVGDVIEVDGLVAKVNQIGIRTSKVLTRDDKYIILPNSILTGNKLINWTHNEKKSRFDVNVGIAYGSDVELAMGIIKQVAIDHPLVVELPEPIVRFNDFGSSSLDMQLLFWTDKPFRVDHIKSEMRIQIDKQFRENNITIPFPQRTLHFADKDIFKK